MIRRQRFDPGSMWSFAVLGFAAAIALAVTVWQRSPVIFLMAVTAECLGVFICSRWRHDRHFVLFLFSAGYLARMVAASVSWVTENRTGFWIARFASDGQGNFEVSQQPLPFAMVSLLRTTFAGAGETGVNATGWVLYNRTVTLVGDLLGGAHPLANVQLQLLSGALLAPVVYALAKRLAMPRTGRWAAWIVALHPMLIAYSAALIRDETISLLGFVVLVLALDTERLRRRSVRRWLLLALVVVVLITLRIASAVYFALAGGIFILAVRRTRFRAKRFAAVALPIALGLGFAFAAGLPSLLDGTRWASQAELRRDATSDSSSLGAHALERGALLWLPAGVALHFIAPFPFYRQFQDPDAGFLHYWTGVGALVNQFLLVFFVIGTAVAVARRNRAIVIAACITVGFAIVSTIMFGDPARYMCAHAAPLIFLIAAYGYLRLAGMRAIAVLGSAALLIIAHAGYFVTKGGVLVAG